MRVFIGSSGEQKQLVEWLTGFMRSDYSGVLEPVPWTVPWAGGKYILETLLEFVETTDAAILFSTADDMTSYRETQRFEPRDNLLFEAGLFVAAHGRERTQLMVPQYPAGDPRQKVALPIDVAGLSYNSYQWVDGNPASTGLPTTARTVCNALKNLGPRVRTPAPLRSLVGQPTVEEIRTLVGEWSALHAGGIQRLAADSNARSVDILAAYRVGDIHKPLEAKWKAREGASVRACFANMWDDALLATYRRKYDDRSADHIRNAVKESIEFLLGPCEVRVENGKVSIANVQDPPRAKYEIRLTPQRITYSFYRIDDIAFLVPLDMKRAQNPSPLAWALAKDTAPRAFAHYLQEYETMFSEAIQVYPPA